MNGLRTNINPRVLILTENPIYSQQLSCDRLYRYQIQQCCSTIEALEICQPQQIQCLILDWESTEINQNFLQHLRQVCIPMVLLVEEKNEYIVTPLTPDYLIKETLTIELLCFAVGQAIAQAELKQKLAEAEHKLQQYDPIKEKSKQSTQNLLNQTEITLQTFLNNIPAIVYTKDLNGRYLSINKEFEEVLQFTAEQVCDKTDLDFLPIEIATALRANDQKAILSREAIHLEETVLLEDGLHTYIATKFPLMDDYGEPYALAGISIDISDRKAAESLLKKLNQELEDRVEQRTIALKTSENRYRELMDGASDGILQADIHGNLVECNRQAEKLFGYSRDQLLQLHISQIHPTEVLAEAFAHFSAVIGGGTTSVLPSLVIRNDGSHIPVEITASLIANQLAIAIQQANLYQKLSSELNQKKVLLKEIHHRVKNNLQVMSSILHLQFRNTPPEIKLLSEEYQNRILAMSLIHDQLYRNDDLANIDFSNYIANLTSNLFQCYGTNQELIQTCIEVNNIFLPLDQSIPLGLIINELVSNALKYAFPKMHGNIKIKLVQTNSNLTLTVSDNGVGIPANLDLANTDGLGMQLIQSLTEQLDGEFSFDGKNGLTVQITFPNF